MCCVFAVNKICHSLSKGYKNSDCVIRFYCITSFSQNFYEKAHAKGKYTTGMKYLSKMF